MQSAWLSTRLRAARPRVIAALNRKFGNVDLAEDAFQEAAARATRKWTESTLPGDPVAWLIVVGRNHAIDQLRRTSREQQAEPEQLDDTTSEEDPEATLTGDLDNAFYRDDIIRLLFTCCHPILRKEQQIALALKIVAGLSVAEIARAFLVAPKTMEQRITRAKRKLQAAQLSFEAPDRTARTARLNSVLAAIYLLFNEGYAATGGSVLIRDSLCEEAVRLARLVERLFPDEPEARGLLALCLAHHARRKARLDANGAPILLEDQERALWDRRQIAEARVLLEAALRHRSPGPFQVEAAIATTHALAGSFEATDWHEIGRLYLALEKLRPSPVVTLNRGVALSRTDGPQAALDLIAPLAPSLDGYAAFHAAYGVLLADMEQSEAALTELKRALETTGTEAERDQIRKRIKKIQII